MTEVRRHDPYRFITSGHSHLRPAAWHMRTERTWTADSPAQQLGMLTLLHPDTIHHDPPIPSLQTRSVA